MNGLDDQEIYRQWTSYGEEETEEENQAEKKKRGRSGTQRTNE